MNIYKLKYQNKEQALSDLISKEVYIETDEGLIFGEGIHAIVDIGLIILEDGTYDENGNQITPPIYIDGYHYDVMCVQEIDFGDKSIIVNNPKHKFLGNVMSEHDIIFENEIFLGEN
jgi:hypothetical protein